MSHVEDLTAARTVQASRIVQELREQILDGDRAPGSRLGQELLAAEFGASRMPIREALRALEAEGLVIVKPHSGAWVAGLDAEEFEQCYKLREAVEPMVIVESLPHLGAEQIDRAAELADRIGRPAGPVGCGVHVAGPGVPPAHLCRRDLPVLTELVTRLAEHHPAVPPRTGASNARRGVPFHLRRAHPDRRRAAPS